MSQNGWGCKGPLEVTLSKPPAQAGSPRTHCPGLCPGGFWVSFRMEIPQPLWELCLSSMLLMSGLNKRNLYFLGKIVKFRKNYIFHLSGKSTASLSKGKQLKSLACLTLSLTRMKYPEWTLNTFHVQSMDNYNSVTPIFFLLLASEGMKMRSTKQEPNGNVKANKVVSMTSVLWRF